MAASVSFNGNKITQELDLLTQVQLPFLAKQTINKLIPVVKEAVKHEMRDSFKTVSPFTLKSVLHRHWPTKTELWTEVFLRDQADKGNAPSNYLLPQIKGGLVYQTRFQWRLKDQVDGYNGRYMLPLHNSPAALKNAQGRIRASQYVQAGYGVKAFEDVRASTRNERYRTQGIYEYIPWAGGSGNTNGKIKQRIYAIGRGKALAPGIYRTYKTKDPVQVFKQLGSVPTVQKSFDFKYAAELAVQKNVQQLFNQTVAETIRPNG